MDKKHYKCIDIYKWIMAIFVVIIHTQPLMVFSNQEWYDIYTIVLNTAVPFFFTCTGYFLGVKMDFPIYAGSNLNKIKGYLIKTIRLYFIWTAIYIPISIYWYINSDAGIFYNVIHFFRAFFIIGGNRYSWQFWYLLACIYVVFIYYLIINKLKNDKYIIYSMLICLLLGWSIVFLGEYEIGDSLKTILKVVTNILRIDRLLNAYVQISIGWIFARKKLQFSLLQRLLLVLVTIVLLHVNVYATTYFGTILLSIIIFEIVLSSKFQPKYNTLWFRKSSTIIYLSHMIIYFLYVLIFKEFDYYGVDAFVVTTIGSILLSQFIISIENRFKIVKYVFGA